MDVAYVGRVLAIGGSVSSLAAFLGWLALAVKINNAGMGQIPLTCLISTGGTCGIVYGIAQFENGLVTLIPVAFWLGALALVAGGIMIANVQSGEGYLQSTSSIPTYGGGGGVRHSSQLRYDTNKWATLLRYDEEIRAAAEGLRKYGPRYEAMFAADYLQINDKSYLVTMVEKIATLAREAPQEDLTEYERGLMTDFSNASNWRIGRGETLAPASAAIVQRASSLGWQVEYWPDSNLMFRRGRTAVNCERNTDIAKFGRRLS
jgi:hypothetical protein